MNRQMGFRVVSRPDDWWVLQGRHPNVLVTGPRDATHAFLSVITASLEHPIRHLNCRAPLDLPTAAGTIVLDDVDALSREEQEGLLRWLDAAQCVESQTIALTTVPLFAQVRAGAFLDTLYYRLNVVHLQVARE
jgi:sigma-54-interacting transcriptional regulator